MPRDRLGMIAAREIGKLRLPGVTVFYGETVPESLTSSLRNLHPDHILMIDATDMEDSPGTLAVIEPERIHAISFSTHALPLSTFMEYLEKDLDTKVTLIGIQPEGSSECDGLSDRELEGLNHLFFILRKIFTKSN